MGLGAKIEDFTEIMKKKTGLGWDFFFREKDLDEIFPFDNVSNGIKKEYLKKIYLAAKETAAEPIDTEGLLRPPCWDKCTGCGVCQNPNLPKYMKPDHSKDITEVADKIKWTKPVKNRILRFRIKIKPEYRYADAAKLKYHARRALFNVEVPIINSLRLASDIQLFHDWTAGYDILEVEIPDKRYEIDTKTLPEKLNKYCEAFEFVACELYTAEASNIRSNFDVVLYGISIPMEDYSYLTIQSKIKEFDSADYYEIKVKQKGQARDSTEVVKLNGKDLCEFIVARQEGNSTRLYMALKGVAGPYDMLTALLKTSKARALSYVAERLEYLLKDSSEGTLSMFSDFCEQCGNELETNMQGELVSDNHCLRCMCLNGEI